jgi:hypothetical protein
MASHSLATGNTVTTQTTYERRRAVDVHMHALSVTQEPHATRALSVMEKTKRTPGD